MSEEKFKICINSTLEEETCRFESYTSKHSCPKCGGLLLNVDVSRRAKDYRFMEFLQKQIIICDDISQMTSPETLSMTAQKVAYLKALSKFIELYGSTSE